MDINNTIQMSIDMGYSKKEIYQDLLSKGVAENAIRHALEEVWPPMPALDKKSLRFLFPFIATILSSLAFLIGYFVHYEIRYVITTIAFLILSYFFFTLKRFAILFWGVLYIVVELYLIFVFFYSLSHQVNSTYSKSGVVSMILFFSCLLYYTWDLYFYDRAQKRSLL